MSGSVRLIAGLIGPASEPPAWITSVRIPLGSA
jgi:hypothetical protein